MKINDIINKYGSVEYLNNLVQEYRYNGNNFFKETSAAVCNDQRNRKKVETFKSKYGNLGGDLNHRAPPQDARPPAQDQRPLSKNSTLS